MSPTHILRCSAAALIVHFTAAVPLLADEPVPVTPASSWSEVYDPFVVRSLNVAISETYRAQYNGILTQLINGPYAPANLQSTLTELEELLTPYLLNDPNNQIGDTPEAIADYFTYLHNWVEARHSSVSSQLIQNGPPAPRPPQ